MAINATTLARELAAIWTPQFQQNLRPKLPFLQWVRQIPIAQNSGSNIIRLPYLPDYTGEEGPTTRVAEDDNPTLIDTTRFVVNIPTYDYQKAAQLERKTVRETIHTIVPAVLERITRYAAEQHNILAKEGLNSSTNVLYAGGVSARTAVAAGPSMADIRTLEQALKGEDVDKITSILRTDGSTDIRNIPATYIGITSTQGATRLSALTDFIPVHQYASIRDIYEGEVGSIGGFRVIETNIADVFADAGASSADVYTMIAFGQNALVQTYVEGEKDRINVRPFGENGDDINRRRMFIGWFTNIGYGINEEKSVYRYEFTNA